MRRECEPVAKKRAGSGFAKDCRGNVAILFGIVCVPVMVLMGLAIDTARALLAAETAQNALDASALAAAQALTRGGLDDSEVARVAKEYFLANAAGKVSFASFGPVQVESNRETGAVTVSVDTTVETTLGALAHVEEISMHRSATALMGMSDSDIELGLMLDVTTSMDDDGKLEALKAATSDLIDELMPEGDNSGRVRIALAPYSEQVNVGGRLLRQVGDGAPPKEFQDENCVVERKGRYANTDAAPFDGAKFHVLTSQERRRYERESGRDKPPCPPAVIQPLSTDAARLKEIVNGYDTAGWTAGHLGIQWAWNLISPEWGGVLPGGSRPRPYGEKDLIKAVVLMTDGEFNTAYTGARLNKRAMTRESFGHAADLCDNIKREEVIVFSVAFALDKPEARRALKDCASSEDHFYRAENEEELRRAYRNIAIELTELRITE